MLREQQKSASVEIPREIKDEASQRFNFSPRGRRG